MEQQQQQQQHLKHIVFGKRRCYDNSNAGDAWTSNSGHA